MGSVPTHESITISHYKSIDKIGCGGFADVYRVVDVESMIQYAAKRLRVDKLMEQARCDEMKAVDIINREVENLRKCIYIDQIIRFIDFVRENSNFFLVMEYCPGGTLETLLESSYTNGLPGMMVRKILRQILYGLRKIHDINIIHADIKPNNIFVFNFEESIIKIGDLGLSMELPVGKSKYVTSTLRGTPSFMAPELFTSNSSGIIDKDGSGNIEVSNKSNDSANKKNYSGLSRKSDVYAVGITLFKMIFGRYEIIYEKLRFDDKKEYFNQIVSNLKVKFTVPDELIDFLSKTVESNPNDRCDTDQLLNHKYLKDTEEFEIGRCGPQNLGSPVNQRKNRNDAFLRLEDILELFKTKVIDPKIKNNSSPLEYIKTIVDKNENKWKISLNFDGMKFPEDNSDDSFEPFSILLCTFAQLSKLSLNNCQLNDFFMLSFSKSLKSLPLLSHLDLSSNRIGGLGAKYLSEGLSSLKSLQSLYLAQNNIDDNGISFISEKMSFLTNLNAISFAANQLTEFGIKSFSESFIFISKLTFLNICKNNIRDNGIDYISNGFKYIGNLNTIFLGNNNITEDGMKSFSANLKYVPNMNQINMDSNIICDNGLKYLSENLKWIKRLSILSFSNNKIFQDGIQYLSDKMFCLKTLTQISLGKNMIGDEGLQLLLDAIPNKNVFDHLSTPYIAMTVDGLKCLCDNFVNLPNLKALIIPGNKFGDEGIKYMADHFDNCQQLETLLLGDSEITNEGIIYLSEKLLLLTKISMLVLDLNSFNDQGVKYLANQLPYVTALRHLNIKHNEVTKETIQYLQQKNPNLTIVN